VADCFEWVWEIAGQEGLDELHTLHHAGHGKCKEKVQELLEQVEDEEKKTQIQGKLPFCAHVWMNQHSQQHHGHHQQEEGAEGQKQEQPKEDAAEGEQQQTVTDGQEE
jgi:hypothetical protein